jgi:hypothetical protein
MQVGPLSRIPSGCSLRNMRTISKRTNHLAFEPIWSLSGDLGALGLDLDAMGCGFLMGQLSEPWPVPASVVLSEG